MSHRESMQLRGPSHEKVIVTALLDNNLHAHEHFVITLSDLLNQRSSFLETLL